MKAWLYNIRKPDRDTKWSEQIANSMLVLVLGITLGVVAKWLDSIPFNSAVWWQYILGILDLRNVFSEFAIWLLIALAVSVYSRTPLRASLNSFLFFAGMCISYHLYTIVFAGFNPQRYMMIWYGFTLLAPVLAFICWFGKGETKVSIIIDIFILAVMMSVCFAIGLWYIDVTRIINVLIFAGSISVLYSGPKQTVISLLGAVALSFAFRMLV